MRLECNKLHGIIDGSTIEFKCKSRFCGAKRGVVVLHKFDLATGILVETVIYKEPHKTTEVEEVN